MDQNVVPFDIGRMLLGDTPPSFMAEIVVRTVIVYVYTFAMVRWLGGRSIAQLSVVEFLLVIALGSAVGDSMFYPNVPLLHALAVITIVVLVNKGIDEFLARLPQTQKLVDAPPVEVINHGKVLDEGLKTSGYSKLEIFEQLRMQGVRDTGEVETAILESNGRLSVFKLKRPVKGEALLPPQRMPSSAGHRRGKGKDKQAG